MRAGGRSASVVGGARGIQPPGEITPKGDFPQCSPKGDATLVAGDLDEFSSMCAPPLWSRRPQVIISSTCPALGGNAGPNNRKSHFQP